MIFDRKLQGFPKGFQGAGSGGQKLVFNRPRLAVVKMDQNGLYVTLRDGIWAPAGPFLTLRGGVWASDRFLGFSSDFEYFL